MSLVTAATSYLSRMALQSARVSAVLPEPTGPPMPTLKGCVVINLTLAKNFHRKGTKDAKKYKGDGSNWRTLWRYLSRPVDTLDFLCALCVLAVNVLRYDLNNR